MPTSQAVVEKINTLKNGIQDNVRREYLLELSKKTGRDTIIMSSACTIDPPRQVHPAALSITQQDVQAFMAALHGLGGEGLDLIIHSPGGSAEATEQIVRYLREKYSHIRGIIPQYAMSAATMIACACDEIVLGKHSAIGPIDPQIVIPSANGPSQAPAQTILDEFDQAKQEIKADQTTAPIWVRRMDKYPPGILKICSNTIDLTKQIVEEWLKTWMLKDNKNKDALADNIADWLGNHQHHKTHGRPIGIQEARKHGLIVKSLEDDNDFQDAVMSVFHAAMHTHLITPCTKFVESHLGQGKFLVIQHA